LFTCFPEPVPAPQALSAFLDEPAPQLLSSFFPPLALLELQLLSEVVVLLPWPQLLSGFVAPPAPPVDVPQAESGIDPAVLPQWPS
jgi:hypothetical protein